MIFLYGDKLKTKDGGERNLLFLEISKGRVKINTVWVYNRKKLFYVNLFDRFKAKLTKIV